MDIKKLRAQSAAFHRRAVLCGMIPGAEFYANVLSREAKRIDDEIATEQAAASNAVEKKEETTHG